MLSPMVLSGAAITLANAAGLDDRDDFRRLESKACFKTASYMPPGSTPARPCRHRHQLWPVPARPDASCRVAAPYHMLSTASSRAIGA